MIVVSEIGEQWSPQTAPARHAEMEIISIVSDKTEPKPTTIGIRIPNVPHDVPVENEISTARPNRINGKRNPKLPILFSTNAVTNREEPYPEEQEPLP